MRREDGHVLRREVDHAFRRALTLRLGGHEGSKLRKKI